MGLIEPDIETALEDFVGARSGADAVLVHRIEPLPGGAIQENYAVDLTIQGGSFAGSRELVLRSDARSAVGASLSRAQEFAVLRRVHGTGAATPRVLWLCEDTSLLGRAFYLMERLPGTANARALVRTPWTDAQRRALVESLGGQLACIHSVRPPDPELTFLGEPPGSPALARVARYREYLDALGQARPVLEWALRWLEVHAPDSEEVVLCHCDFRTGNVLVSGGQVSGVLDWEFAGWSDPLEDLGWMCARSWRFGAWCFEAGGLGHRSDFYHGYERGRGVSIDALGVAYWEVMAAVRWAVIALQQSQRFLSRKEESLELALTGRMVPEMELDMLELIEAIDAGTVNV